MNDSGTSRKRMYCGPFINGRSGPVKKSGIPKITAHAVRWISQPVYFDCGAVMVTNVIKNETLYWKLHTIYTVYRSGWLFPPPMASYSNPTPPRPSLREGDGALFGRLYFKKYIRQKRRTG